MKTFLLKQVAGPFCVTSLLIACAAVFACAQEPTTGRVAQISQAGKLKVRQRRGDAFAEATVGMIVRRGYRLDLEAGARASVMCADGKVHHLIPGAQGCPCVAPDEGAVYDGSRIPRTRGPDTLARRFPVVISPRKTQLLTTRPMLSWTPVDPPKSGGVTYTISLANYQGTIWSRKVISQTTLEYPADEKPLMRGEEYQFVVEAGNKTSESDDSAGLGFYVVTDEEAKKINDAETAIRALNLGQNEKQFFIADLYAARGFSSEAIIKLQSLKTILKELAVLRLLGDLYAAAGLHREAITNYESALTLPKAATDLEGQALTLTSLGHAYEMLNKPDQAKASWTKSVELLAKLGEKVTIEELAKPKK